jgi:hypothetical protein
MAYYVICDDDSKHESMTKEQILAAITQAIKNGSIGDIDTGFVTRLKEKNGGGAVTIWVGTRAQYNAITEKEVNCLYIITDDTTGEDILRACEKAANDAEEAKKMASGMQCIDITNKIALSWVVGDGGKNLTQLSIGNQRFRYCPALGVVFYKFGVHYCGTMAANEIIQFRHNGGYAPTGEVVNSPAVCFTGYFNSDDFEAAYSGGNGGIFYIKAKGSVGSQTEEKGVSVAGWYFCDGE